MAVPVGLIANAARFYRSDKAAQNMLSACPSGELGDGGVHSAGETPW